MKMSWFGFWIFMTAFIICDTWLYSKGHETFFWRHKTEAEKTIQMKQADGCSCDVR